MSISALYRKISSFRPFFFITWFTDPPTRFFRILKKTKKNFLLFSKKKIFIGLLFSNFFFFYKFSVVGPKPPDLKPLANKLWSPVHNEREEIEPTDPVQGYETISK